ncbi:MAG: hypothetical protein ACFFAU_01550 [Candidatus Hodarchaeota archaeon]
MKSTVRTILNARARQRLMSIRVQGFKCEEVEYKRYINLKLSLKSVEGLITKLENTETLQDNALDIWYKKRNELNKEIAEYEKKHHINQKPKKPETESKSLMKKVLSFFNRGRR